MQLLNEPITQTVDEHFLLENFHLDGKTILELGCGSATMTKKIASTGQNRTIYATEVDTIQHEKNCTLNLDNVTFLYAGAQEIPLQDESIDMVLMFKSFHHIPKELMTKALKEIKRVLKPNGLAYISEPLFQGDQNHLISLFHDEQQVRTDAFEAIKNFVDQEEMVLFQEIFSKVRLPIKILRILKHDKWMLHTMNPFVIPH
jgi:ubiquinone/menaquinone biosynthesis C-methylase UbiE